MPNFLNPWIAAAAAAVAVPSLLVLYFLKLRRREVTVPSTLLWKKAIQDLQVNAPFQRLRKNLLLLLQMLLLILLILALARPVMNYTPGAGSLAVILIDRSASMLASDVDGKTRLEEAKRQAKELVDTLDKDGQAMVVAFDDSADIVRSFTNDRTMLKQAIDSIKGSDRRSSLKTAFQLAEAKAASFNPEQRRPGAGPKPQVWLYSDGRVTDANELALRFADLKYSKIGSADANNAAIVALSAKRNYERPSEVQVFVRLANFGPKPRGAVIQLSVDGQIPPGGINRDLMLVPERWSQAEREKVEKEQNGAEFRLELLKGAVIRVELKENGGDVLAADDTAQIVVPAPRTLRVGVVSKSGNLWIEKFILAAGLKDAAMIGVPQFEDLMKDPQAVASEYDVLIFDRYQPKALPPAGNFIYFNSVPPDTKVKNVLEGGGIATVQKNGVLDWERNHPILRHLNPRFQVAESLKLQLPLDAQELVQGREGPLVVLYREGRSAHLIIPFDINESTWPVEPSFPIFWDRALQYLALGTDMDVRQSFQPGASPRIPRYNLQQASGELKEVRLLGPGSFATTVAVPPAGDFALPALEKVGLYTLEPAIPQFDRLAVNLLDDNESNLLPIDKAPGGVGEVISASGGKSRFELWWWIVACCAIPLCMIEWWVYTRRMHL